MSDAKILEMLKAAYAAQVETLENYLATSVWLDGAGSRMTAEALDGYITQKLVSAKKIARRLKELGATSPALFHIDPTQRILQPPEDTEPMAVVYGILEAERHTIIILEKLMAICEQKDVTTEDLAVEILAAEERHRAYFEALLTRINEERKAKPLRI
jgi:ferritin-like protein